MTDDTKNAHGGAEAFERIGDGLFAYAQDGWRKGYPVMVNRLWVYVHRDHRFATAEEHEALIQRLEAALAPLSSPAETEAPISAEDLVYIWSGEHNAYWRPDSAGYTVRIQSAGLYSRAEAERILASAGPEKRLEIEAAARARSTAQALDAGVVEELEKIADDAEAKGAGVQPATIRAALSARTPPAGAGADAEAAGPPPPPPHGGLRRASQTLFVPAA